MDTNEKWNLLVNLVYQKLTARENEVQSLWEEIFADANFFGYSRFGGEIDAHRTMHIGSSDRTIPDIIIRDSVNHQDLFVVELKQHNMLFDNRYKEQLFSYMRLLQLTIGVLICDKIYLYNLEINNEIVMEIPFIKDSANGSKFVELLSKGNFKQERVKNFIREKYAFDQHVKEITQDISALDIKQLVIEYYQQKYTTEEIEKALAKIKIEIKSIATNCPPKSKSIVFNKLMTRSRAIELFRNCGYQLNNNITFASKNKSANNYWANPNITCLEQDFWLILNDNMGNKLYLFKIPANAIQKSQLVTRSDKPNKIDLQIDYHNPSFIDNRSGYSFQSFLAKEIDY